MWSDVGPFPEFLEETPRRAGLQNPAGLDVTRLAILPQVLKRSGRLFDISEAMPMLNPTLSRLSMGR